MKWEAIKKQVAGQVRDRVIGGYDWTTNTAIFQDLLATDFQLKSGKTSREMLETYADKAYQVVMEWDVRAVGRLRDLFVGYFPKSLQKGLLTIDYDEKGDWAVYKAA